MVSRELGEDVSFLLYFVPIIVSIIYGLYEWVLLGRSSSSMPGTAFLIVTKSPYLYLLSIAVVCLALIVDVASSPPNEGEALLTVNATRMQILSVVVLIVTFAAALSVGGYGLGNGLSIFIAARYSLIYSFSLVGISILLVPRQLLGSARANAYAEAIGLILIVVSPVVLYIALKLHVNFDASAVGAIVVGLIGLYLFTNSSRLFRKKPESVVQAVPQKESPVQSATKP